MKGRKRASEIRATTPPSINTVTVSEFVRGGLYDLEQPTLVLSHGQEIGTWIPRGQVTSTSSYLNNTTTPTSDTVLVTPSAMSSPGVALYMATTSGMPDQVEALNLSALNDSITKLTAYLQTINEKENESDAS